MIAAMIDTGSFPLETINEMIKTTTGKDILASLGFINKLIVGLSVIVRALNGFIVFAEVDLQDMYQLFVMQTLPPNEDRIPSALILTLVYH
jgi:hypothetical protein